MDYEVDRSRAQDGQPSLSEMVGTAVDHLKGMSDEGFFLMVESGRIDHAHHATNAKRAMEEANEMENAVQVKITFLFKRCRWNHFRVPLTCRRSSTELT